MSDEREPLWTNQRIYDGRDPKEIRLATMEARIAELEARLAQTWQPLPDGEYGNVMVARNGEVLSVLERDDLLGYSFWSGRFISDNIRLCRLVERAEVQPWQPLTDYEREIIEAMVEDWLQLYEPGSNEWADAQVIVSWLNNYRGTFADDLRQQVTEDRHD